MAMLVDPLLSEAVSKLLDVIIHVLKQTANFKSKLQQLQSTLNNINPIFDEIEKLNKVLDRPTQETDQFVSQLEDAKELVLKCEKIKWNYIKRYTHSCKLQDLDNKLLRFFNMEVQAHQSRDIKETLVVVKDVQRKLSRVSLGSLVPVLEIGNIVGFDEPLEKLKAMVVIKDGVVVVSAAGGCGKTTLVTMLCHDHMIKDKFQNNIFFVTVSKTPNLKQIVNTLYQQLNSGQQLDIIDDNDAKKQLGIFMSGIKSDYILLVLDDVWSDSFIDNFMFPKKGYTILVTSRFVFTKYDTYTLEPLSDQDATTLFCRAAFADCEKKRTAIKDDLVNKMVKCCKKHPLCLSVIGGFLNGKHESIWRSRLKTLSEGKSVLDLNKDILLRLETSLEDLDEDAKLCFFDLGLFPEDQRIPATALMDMWVELYNHDEEGDATIAKIFELSYKNLVNIMPTGKDSTAVVSYCEQQFVMQHDLLRELAIHRCSQEPIAERERLIIEVYGEDLPKSIEQVQHSIHARILSISTDESFSSKWYNMEVPEVEVLVLSFLSKNYTLPQFMEKMKKLKVLNVTNYGFYSKELENFPLLGHLSSLTRIRLERISISNMSKSILELVNLRKISLIMCEIGKTFDECSSVSPNILPSLVEIEMDYCHDLVEFPAVFCNLVCLRKLRVTNCHELGALPEGFGQLTNLEVMSLHSCTKLAKLPQSFAGLQKLSILDISDCLGLSELPVQIGKLCGLRTIHMKGCTGLCELPPSAADLRHIEVVCDEEISYLWRRELPHVKITEVEEDEFGNFHKIF